jgi:hypothetical protein
MIIEQPLLRVNELSVTFATPGEAVYGVLDPRKAVAGPPPAEKSALEAQGVEAR